MVSMIQDLFRHQAWADAAILESVQAHEEASRDDILRQTLHHVVVVQRAFLSLFRSHPFDFRKEMLLPATLGDQARLFRDTHAEELDYISRLQDADLSRQFDMPWIPNCRPTVAEGLLQVVMHSQNHRGQCLTRLRTIAGKAPTLDYIMWVKDRPAAAWSAT